MKEKYLNLNYNNVLPFVELSDLKLMQKEINQARKTLDEKTGLGNDYIGWTNLVDEISPELIDDIQITAKKIKKQSDVLVVIGIGGSYLGAKAAIEYMKPYFPKRKSLEVVFAGQNLSSTYLSELLDYLKKKDFTVNVISKSGTTTEPAVAFRAIKQLLEEKYSYDEVKERIIATTDASKGALRTLADQEGYKTYIVPDDIGGRFSVLTPVGLLPIAAAGIDIKKMLRGAKAAKRNYKVKDIYKNDVHMYVALRNLLYRKGFALELLVNNEPKLNYFSEWWKQLFGESEGKDLKGLFVSSASFTTDLHSLGQFIQEGKKVLFETMIDIQEPEKDLYIGHDKNNLDQLNYLENKSVDYVNRQALKGTMLAHLDGQTPNMLITIPKIDAYSFGYLVYFFELACGISGYVLNVNPFNQPGVESYKKNMFALLDKPGYESLSKELKERI
ncbi:glucose-6-phosphate isomerase [Hujiaoplasma nucleasis]|uniref:Glucose-6-phosphate isomerase n=1 Tax=Hujiaoplasma nucleasis TaxID=2725268 RepID=A0A7L6N2U9_9MOLU|nr:glucose-6-phosphate isomerase [Hujiaoplasma nucleasis]QLY40493.1 glucose-6-phosphate isomerase [Hujiaoplasma nucleasis]